MPRLGPPELAQKVADTIGEYNAILLANHGLSGRGPTMDAAFAAAEEIEFVARIYYQTKSIGKPVILPKKRWRRCLKSSRPMARKKMG